MNEREPLEGSRDEAGICSMTQKKRLKMMKHEVNILKEPHTKNQKKLTA